MATKKKAPAKRKAKKTTAKSTSDCDHNYVYPAGASAMSCEHCGQRKPREKAETED